MNCNTFNAVSLCSANDIQGQDQPYQAGFGRSCQISISQPFSIVSFMWWMQESTILYCQYSETWSKRRPIGFVDSIRTTWFMWFHVLQEPTRWILHCSAATAEIPKSILRHCFCGNLRDGCHMLPQMGLGNPDRYIVCSTNMQLCVCVFFVFCVCCKSVKVPKLRHFSRYLDGLSTYDYDIHCIYDSTCINIHTWWLILLTK